MTPLQVIRAMTLYIYNVSPVKIISDVYGENINYRYQDEKMNRLIKASFASFFGELDDEHQQRFVDAAMKRYGKEVTG